MKKIEIDGKQEELSTILRYALNNSQSKTFEDLATKDKLLAKLDDESVKFTTDEVQIIKTACLQTLKDGATLAVIKTIAPNDL